MVWGVRAGWAVRGRVGGVVGPCEGVEGAVAGGLGDVGEAEVVVAARRPAAVLPASLTVRTMPASRILRTRNRLLNSGNGLLVFRCERSMQDRHQTSAAEAASYPGLPEERMAGPVITGRAHGTRSAAYSAEAVGAHPSRGPDRWLGMAAAAGNGRKKRLPRQMIFRSAALAALVSGEQVVSAKGEPPLGQVLASRQPAAGDLLDLPDPVAQGLLVDVELRSGRLP